MAGDKALKQRIRSTKNIQQITKAMEAVSAVKMRRSESAAIKGRPYALHALDILKKVEKSFGKDAKDFSPLLEKRKIKKGCLVVITSDKGLAGSFNTNALRKSQNFLKEAKYPVDILAIGKKGRDFFQRKNVAIVEKFEGIGDYVELAQAKPISEFIIKLFEEKKYDVIDVIYTNFISALKQEVVHRPLLPLNEENLKAIVENIIPATGKFSELKGEMLKENNREYKFEPSEGEIGKNLIPTLIEIEIFHSILEANASEHAARMVAMKNASENAKEIIGDLTILYNKERQAKITKELIEITSGGEALQASD